MRRTALPPTPPSPALLALLRAVACRSIVAVAPLLLLAACGEPERLTDPSAIADRVADRAREDYEGVRDFTVTGGEYTIYFRRTGPDSLVTFESRAFSRNGSGSDSLGRPVFSPYAPPNTVQWAEGLRSGARLTGVVSEGDETVYVLDALDPDAFAGVPAGTGPDSIRVLVDAETFRIRGLSLVVPASSLDPDALPDAPPVVQRQTYRDFRTTRGLTLPFRATTVAEGLVVSPEQRMLQGGVLGAQRQQAELLPPGEREPALADIDRKLRYLRTGVLEEPFTVEEVRVNVGVPEAAFAPPSTGR